MWVLPMMLFIMVPVNAGACTSPLYCNCHPQVKKAVRPLNVAIVGAGLSGLTLGIQLYESGHHVTIFESREQAKATSRQIRIAIRKDLFKQLCNLGVDGLGEFYRNSASSLYVENRCWGNANSYGVSTFHYGRTYHSPQSVDVFELGVMNGELAKEMLKNNPRLYTSTIGDVQLLLIGHIQSKQTPSANGGSINIKFSHEVQLDFQNGSPNFGLIQKTSNGRFQKVGAIQGFDFYVIATGNSIQRKPKPGYPARQNFPFTFSSN